MPLLIRNGTSNHPEAGKSILLPLVVRLFFCPLLGPSLSPNDGYLGGVSGGSSAEDGTVARGALGVFGINFETQDYGSVRNRAVPVPAGTNTAKLSSQKNRKDHETAKETLIWDAKYPPIARIKFKFNCFSLSSPKVVLNFHFFTNFHIFPSTAKKVQKQSKIWFFKTLFLHLSFSSFLSTEFS